jgi:hypothetical protein
MRSVALTTTSDQGQKPPTEKRGGLFSLAAAPMTEPAPNPSVRLDGPRVIPIDGSPRGEALPVSDASSIWAINVLRTLIAIPINQRFAPEQVAGCAEAEASMKRIADRVCVERMSAALRRASALLPTRQCVTAVTANREISA